MYKFKLILIAFYLVLAPYLLIPELTHYDSKRYLQLVLFGLLLIFIVTFVIKDRDSLLRKCTAIQFKNNSIVSILFLVLVLSGIISVILSDSFNYAFLEYLFFFLLLSLLLLLLPESKKQHYYLGLTIIFTSILYASVYVIIFIGNYISSFIDPMMILWPDKYHFTIIIEGIELRGKEVLYFVHKRFFNHTQTWTLPILIGLLCYNQQKKNKPSISYALFILITFWWMLVIASGGRGTLISIISTLLILITVLRNDIFLLFKNTLLTLISGGILYIILYRFIPGTTLQMHILRTTDSGRLNMWERAFELWYQNPVFGVGPLHYAKIIDGPYASHPHNFYIQFLSEWGIIAFGVLCILLIILVTNVYNNFNFTVRFQKNGVVFLSIAWALLSALLHAFFSGIMHTPMSQIWFVIIVAWLLGYNRYHKSVINRSMLLFKYRNVLFMLLTISILLMTFSDALTLKDHYVEYMNQYPNERFYPRFWNEGLIPKE